MSVPLRDFPYQPQQLPCCGECVGKKKDCVPDPMNCTDFYIWNLLFIEKRRKEVTNERAL